MHKKDYIKLAQALKDSKPEVDERGYNFEGILMGNIEIDVWKNTVEHITETLRLDNPQFNKARFLHACGYTQELKG